MMSEDEDDSLIETLAVLSDTEVVLEIRQADADVAAGRISTLEEVEAEMRSLERLPQRSQGSS